jgi:hypothetical protein
MPLLACRRFPPRLVLLGGCASVVLVLLAAGTADAAAKVPSRQAAAVSLAVPSAGDVSYAVVRVRLAPGKRLSMPAGLAGTVSIFSGRLGGLAIRARAAKWRALRATTRVYVVVSKAQGARADERDVALFVVRRSGRRGGTYAPVRFIVDNARPVVGSFWVHGVDRSGYADVFHARNILSTALANWSRYTRALKLAGAVQAALHPQVRSVLPVAQAAGRVRNPGPWVGGQRAGARVTAIYSLLFGALHSPTAWGALKGSAAVPKFIETELRNRPLANRWRKVVAKVPVIVPDKYAALAKEEKRFTRVSAPRISRHLVAIADSANSATVLGSNANSVPAQMLTINNPDATSQYGGTVAVANVHHDGLQAGVFTQTCDVAVCTFAYPTGVDQQLTILGVPDAGAAVLSLSGCVRGSNDEFGGCGITLSGSTNVTVTERFAQSATLTVNLAPAGSIAFSDPYQTFKCSFSAITCERSLAVGSTLTFAARPAGMNPSSWTGCDSSTAAACTVTITGARSVTAKLDYPLTVAVQAAAGSGGTVTSSIGAINCGQVPGGVVPSCRADIQAGRTVVLSAHPDPQSTFSSWTDCPEPSGTTCTVAMNEAKNVGANFALVPPPTRYPLTVSVTNNPFAPTHTGYVTSTPAGIDCGTVPVGHIPACNADFDSGTTVTLTATVNEGAFELWTGCDTTSFLTCTVLMGQAKNVIAQFG